MQSLYFSLFGECRREYERALAAGDEKAAAEFAEKCAGILKKIAEKTPSKADLYLEKAGKWEATARELREGVRRPKAVPSGSALSLIHI